MQDLYAIRSLDKTSGDKLNTARMVTKYDERRFCWVNKFFAISKSSNMILTLVNYWDLSIG